MTNRALAAVLAVALTVLAAASAAGQNMEQNQSMEESVQVVRTQVQDGFLEDIIGDESTVEATVMNSGSAGDVNVSIDVIDEQGAVLYEDQQENYMEANETQVFEFDVPEVPPGSVYVVADATRS